MASFLPPALQRRLARGVAASLLGLALGGALPLAQAWDGERLVVAGQRIGAKAAAGARDLAVVVAQAAELDEPLRLELVNRFFNQRIRFRDDVEVWGVTDHWASPLELLNRGEGDCEDYAIAKYFSLLAAGTPAARLRLVYVKAMLDGRSQAHMVLAYYAKPDAEPLIMDNLVSDLRPASRRPDLTPAFSFNHEGLWQGTAGPSAGDPLARLAKWRGVVAKAQAEGFL